MKFSCGVKVRILPLQFFAYTLCQRRSGVRLVVQTTTAEATEIPTSIVDVDASKGVGAGGIFYLTNDR